MKPRIYALSLAVAVGFVAAAWAQSSPTPLYYQDASGKPYYSATPKKDASGRDYVPVYTDTSNAPAPLPSTAEKGRILYYRHPMGLPDTSPAPKKDSMGMAYIPVYENDVANADTVSISPDRVQSLGVRTEAIAQRTLSRTIRAVGAVALDERKIAVVAPRYEGWIEKLTVNTTGQSVKKGQPLAEIYSPDLLLAEQEYLVARGAVDAAGTDDHTLHQNSQAIVDAALARLRNWDISPDQLARLKNSDVAARTLRLTAPMDGVVMEKVAVEGMHFAPGDMLYRIANLSTVWVLADVFEQDLGVIQPGQDVQVSVTSYPDRRFAGKVAFIYPSINRETRTAKVRVELANPDGLLKADMYATVELSAAAAAPVTAVPDSAILDNGTRQSVLVERGPGRFEPRAVMLGQKANGYVEIKQGVAIGEKVVVGANFLIDAESNLRAALQSFMPPPAQTEKRP